MGTTYEVVVTHRPAELSRPAIQSAVDAVLAEVNGHLSGWDPQSELARFNAASGTDWIPASELLVEAVDEAQAVSRASGGAFDVTVGPLVRAWGFGADAVAAGCGACARRARTTARSRSGTGGSSRGSRPPALRKSVATLHVDLDGIAPGLAVDRIAERLEALGVRDYLVELGGEVRARGRSPAGRPWRVAVEAPLAGQRRPYALVELDGVGVSTSGDYRDFRELRRAARLAHDRSAHGGPGDARARLGHRAASIGSDRRRLGHGPDGARSGGGHGARAAARSRGAVHHPVAGRVAARVGDPGVRAFSPADARGAMIPR